MPSVNIENMPIVVLPEVLVIKQGKHLESRRFGLIGCVLLEAKPRTRFGHDRALVSRNVETAEIKCDNNQERTCSGK